MVVIDDAKKKLQELTSKKDQLNESEFQDRFLEISSQLDKANKERNNYTEIQRTLQISTAQGKILADNADEIKRSRILTIISSWQHTLNYIFYIVFVLNVFITGLGIAGVESTQR